MMYWNARRAQARVSGGAGGRGPRSITRSILRQGRNAFDMLEHGLDS